MNLRSAIAALLCGLALTGCSTLGGGCPTCGTHATRSSSLVSFLYPDGEAPREDSVPHLRLPLHVGLAFLPSRSDVDGGGLSAAQKEELLERIRRHFADRPFVADITVVPDYYLSNGPGFAGLAGIQRLYNVDVMALVSYDQVTYAGDRKYRSLAYLTILGAFIVEGSEHDVTTLVDLAVVDPRTRSLVLRAGGTDTGHGTSTFVDQAKEVRSTDAHGFEVATGAMIEHFDAALARFEEDVKSGKARAEVVHKDGTPGGAGALGGTGLAALVLLAGGRRLGRAAQRARPAAARAPARPR